MCCAHRHVFAMPRAYHHAMCILICIVHIDIDMYSSPFTCICKHYDSVEGAADSAQDTVVIIIQLFEYHVSIHIIF
jgi:hypothetical protein